MDDPGRRRRARWLSIAFVLALVAGPGPGAWLGQGDGRGTLFGMPGLYAWSVLWFLVLAAIVLIAHRTLWTAGDDDP